MAVGIALAGLDFRPFLRTSDPAERLVETVVASQVSDALERDRTIERKNLAIEVGGNVGNIVSRAINNLARAMRG